MKWSGGRRTRSHQGCRLHYGIALLLVKSKPRSQSSPDDAGDYLEYVTVSHQNVIKYFASNWSCSSKRDLASKPPRRMMLTLTLQQFGQINLINWRKSLLLCKPRFLSRPQQNNADLQAKISGRSRRERKVHYQSGSSGLIPKTQAEEDMASGPSGRSTKRARTKAGTVVPN